MRDATSALTGATLHCAVMVSFGDRFFMRHPSWQRFIAALLMLTLALAGAGRGALAASMAAAEPTLVVNGIVIPICHPGQDRSDGTPADQATHHDCCDACALCAPVLLPTPPVPAPLSRTVIRLDLPLPATSAPAVARLDTPRSSQGPPAACLALPFEPSSLSIPTA